MKLFKYVKRLNFANMMSVLLVGVSVIGANTRCIYIFHDIKKPEELEKLRKF